MKLDKWFIFLTILACPASFADVSEQGTFDYQGNGISSNSSTGTRNALDLELIFSGSIVDPRSIRTLTSSDTVSCVQSTNPWTDNLSQIGGASYSLGQKTMANSAPLVLASDQSGINTFLDKTGSGTIGALNGTVAFSTNGMSTAFINVTGTFVASLNVEGQDGNGNWASGLNCTTVGGDVVLEAVLNPLAAVCAIGGYSNVRLRANPYTSGTATVNWNIGAGVNNVHATNLSAASFLNSSWTKDGSGNSITSQAINSNQAVHLAMPTLISMNNSSTANLAAGASFTGTADTTSAFSTVKVQFKSDQNSTIQLQQSTDNSNWDTMDSYSLLANIGDSREFPVGAKFIRVVVTNNGGSTTTLLRLQTLLLADGTTTPRLNAPFPNGELRVQNEATQIFNDTYDSGLDTTNRWNAGVAAGGGVAAAGSTGSVTLGTGTTANGYSYLTSQYAFPPVSPGWNQYMNAINLANPVIANGYLFWGFCNPQTTPTAANPISNGIGYEITTGQKLMAVSYASNTRTLIQDLSSSTGNNYQPADAAVHKYFLFFRGDLAYFAIDNKERVVATMLTGAQGPNINGLPLCMMAVAGSSAPASSAVLTSNALFVGNTTGSNHQISDGTFPWRKATITAAGNIQSNSYDGSGNAITSSSSGSKQPYDVTQTVAPTNVYMLPVEIVHTTAVAAGTTVWTMRNSATATKSVYIESINLMINMSNPAGVTATMQYDAERFSGATPTGGTATTVIKADNANPTTQLVDSRQNTGGTALTTTGITFESPFNTISLSANSAVGGLLGGSSVTANSQAQVFATKGFKLAPGEGLALRVGTGGSQNGESLTGSVTWSER